MLCNEEERDGRRYIVCRDRIECDGSPHDTSGPTVFEVQVISRKGFHPWPASWRQMGVLCPMCKRKDPTSDFEAHNDLLKGQHVAVKKAVFEAR